MKKIICCLSLLACLFGCAKENVMPDNAEIIEEFSEELADTIFQDPSNNASFNDFLMGNFGLDETQVQEAELYMGQPNQKTTYFAILTLAEGAEAQQVSEKMERVLQGFVESAHRGYAQGYDGYEIIEKNGRIFAIMHEDQAVFEEMIAYISGL